MVFISRAIQAAGILAAVVSVRADDYDELCDNGLANTDDARCFDCFDYLEDKDSFKACVIVFSEGKLNCGGDFFDELDDQNAALLEMSKRDTEDPRKFTYSKGHWLAAFSIGTTAIPSSDTTFRAWRDGIAKLVDDELGYDGPLPQEWGFKIKPTDAGAKSFENIEVSYNCDGWD